MRPVYRTRVVYIPIPAAAKRGQAVTFPDQQDLKGAIVTSVETFTAQDLAQSPDGNTIVSAADAVRLVLTLAQQSDQRVKQVPYFACNTARNAGEPREYEALLIEWTQSRIEIVEDLAGANVVAAVGIGYYYPDPTQGAAKRASRPRR